MGVYINSSNNLKTRKSYKFYKNGRPLVKKKIQNMKMF